MSVGEVSESPILNTADIDSADTKMKQSVPIKQGRL